MQLSEFSVVTGRLKADMQHHKDMATFYLRLFNQNTPKAGGRVDVDHTTHLQEFYQQMTQFHKWMECKFLASLADFEAVANAVLLDTAG